MKRLLRVVTEDGLRARAIRGTLLSALSFGTQNVVRLAGNLVLTRILFPEAFGIMALVQVVMAGLNMFSQIGIRAAVIQDDRGLDPAFLDTAWCIQIARGILLWLVTWLAAAPMAAFYDAPILEQLLPVAGLIALFQGFNSTKMLTANRELRLGRLTVLAIGTQVAGLLVMIALAIWLKSVWALVIGGLVSPFLVAALSHVVLPGHRNGLRFERRAAGQLFTFGKWIFLGGVATFLATQADRAILGKLVSLDTLAFYNIAFFLASVPMLLMRKLVESVLFPLYAARPPGESAANFTNLARARDAIIASTMAMTFVLALLGNWLVLVLYDPRYEAAAPLLVLIALAQLPAIATANYSTVLLAAGHSGRFSLYTTLSAALKTVLLLLGGLYFGVFGVALAPVFAVILFYPVTVWFVRPYGAWFPRQDAIFLTIALVGGLVVLWFNADVIGTAWDRFARIEVPS